MKRGGNDEAPWGTNMAGLSENQLVGSLWGWHSRNCDPLFGNFKDTRFKVIKRKFVLGWDYVSFLYKFE